MYVGLPGAGGDDAIFVIFEKDDNIDIIEKIESALGKGIAVLPVEIAERNKDSDL